MYFLTNNENNIIAASSDFLTTIGSRDVCSISAMLQNKLIILDDSKLTIPNKDLEYECKISTMYSAFGNLNLHTLSELSSIPQTEEESIAKLQDSTPKKKDNEYDIPDIPTLHKEETNINDDTKIDAETIKQSAETEDLSKTKKIEIEDNIEISEKEDITEKLDSKEKEEIENTKIEDSTQDLKNNELLEILKNIDTDTDTENKNLNITTDHSIEKLADELIEDKETVNENNPIEATQSVEKIVENSTVSNDIINQIQETEELSSKKGGLKKITKKLFPWSNKNNQAIELEENENTPYQIDIKSASELEEKAKDIVSTVENIENKDDSIKLAKSNDGIEIEKEEIKIPEIPSIALEQDGIDSKIEDNINEIEKIAVNKESEIITENEEIKIPEIPTIEKETELPSNSNSSTHKSSKIELLNEKDKIDLDNIKIDSKESVKVDDDNNIDKIKEQISKISTEAEQSISEIENNIVTTNKTVSDNIENNSIAYKVIKLQVDGIDFEKNANKLSIDSSSYKMLLTNYLDEIEKYNSELENGTTSTIDMLQDAGKLLSVDVLTQKLGQLKTEGDRASLIREISLISSLLKEKMDKKLEIDKTYEKPKVEIAQVTEKEQISTSAIPDDIIDITSAQDLLTSINPQSVAFNPSRAAEELNLPKTLIIEFVEDFIAQSKEHLPVMVEAYKKEDIKTIQTTAHMLKGAASNLRLDTIAENLFKIQKEGNINNSAELIKQFVAKLKGLNSEVASLEDVEDEN